MKTIFLLIISALLLVSCGKKSDPEYQANIKKLTIIVK
jgi:uncharacterized protein YcfL